MTRSELFGLALECGISGDLPKAILDEKVAVLRQRLVDYFSGEKGRLVLARAPQVTVEHTAGFPLQQQPVERVVDLLISEVLDYLPNLRGGHRETG